MAVIRKLNLCVDRTRDKGALRFRRRLRATVADWDRTHRDASILLRGPLLAEARRWQAERAEALSGREVEFILLVNGPVSPVNLKSLSLLVFLARVEAPEQGGER
jgi:hypothetical protein